MSSPNPHESDSKYPDDNYSPVRKEFRGESSVDKLKRLVGESKEIRKGHLFGKKKGIAHKMTHKYDVGHNKKGRDEYDSRQDESNPFYK